MKLKSSKGYSLVELLTVIAIIAVLIAISMPQYKKYKDNQNLKEAMAAFMSDIQYAKQRAMAENVNYTVTLSTSSNNYTVQGGTYNVTKNFSSFGGGTRMYWQNFPSNTITFTPRGTLSQTGSSAYYAYFYNSRFSIIYMSVSIMGKVTPYVSILR